MSALTNVEVLIDGKVYTLCGYEEQEYIQKVASYINQKINELSGVKSARHFTSDIKNVFIQINLADDYFKAKAQVEKLEQELEIKEKELYHLKHDLISNQIKTDNADARIKELEAENQELLLKQLRLAEALEDSLPKKAKAGKNDEDVQKSCMAGTEG